MSDGKTGILFFGLRRDKNEPKESKWLRNRTNQKKITQEGFIPALFGLVKALSWYFCHLDPLPFDGWLGDVGQLGPDFSPVSGAQLTAGDDAVCGQLNRGAVLSRNGLAFEPSSYGCLYDAASLGQLLLRTNDSNGL
jgi:hypothetical protein